MSTPGAALKGFSPANSSPIFLAGRARPGKAWASTAKRWPARQITRHDQDQLAFDSHQKAAAAYQRGFFKDLVTPFRGLERDNILRPDTTMEKLATLKPAFDKSSGQGTLTAGNSTNLTDGASAALLASDDWAGRTTGVQQFSRSQVAPSISSTAKSDCAGWRWRNCSAQLSAAVFDFYESHEAFAAQCCAP